ncbi:MAG TPA: hypothetical protein VGO87_10160 [Acidimicrobiia bacterium]
MSGEEKRAARLAAARAEFASYPAPPTLGWWPCPRDPGLFRYYDGTGWTDQTLGPAMKPDPPPSAGAAWKPVQPAPRPAEPEPPPPSGRGSAIEAGQAEMRRLIHPVTADDLRGIPEASHYFGPDLPHPPARGWWVDPAAPDLDQQRFHTGTGWSDFTATTYKGRIFYHRSTMAESRRRNELQLDARKHDPHLALPAGPAVWIVLLTALASCLLVIAPALPAGASGDITHSAGVALGLGVLLVLWVVAAQTDRGVPLEWRSTPMSLWYGLAVVAFVVLRGYHSVLSALGLG